MRTSLLTTAEAVDLVVTALAATPVPARGPRVLAVDGRSGSGKTDLAAAVAGRVGAPVVHLDDVYPGWDGLAEAVGVLADDVLAPLRAGRAAVYRRWDWAADAPGPLVRVAGAPTVVLEGVGAGAAGPVDLLVWLEAGTAVRRRRGLDRDGETFAPHWERWAAQEDELFARRPVAPLADLVLGTDGPSGFSRGAAGRAPRPAGPAAAPPGGRSRRPPAGRP